MDTRKVKHQYHLSKWMPIVQECNNSGMTVKEWCLENKVSDKQFFYWQRRVRQELCTSLQIPEKEPKQRSTIFASLPIKGNHKETSQSYAFKPDLVISIGDYRLELANQTNPEILETILKVIHHV
jgi:putative transposase